MAINVGVIYFAELKKEELVWALLQAGAEAALMDSDISIYSSAHEDAIKIAEFIDENHVDAMLSYDFCPALSDACMIKGIPYISWIYDCPMQTLYDNSVKNNCNYIFSFDKRQVEVTKKYGGKNVFYQTLGTNMLRNTSWVITPEEEKKYSCEVSFVGNLFSNSLYDLAVENVGQETLRECNAIIDEAYGVWDGVDRIHGKLSASAIDDLKNIDRTAFGTDFKMDIDDFFSVRLFSYYLAFKERTEMLKRLSIYDLRFHTGEKNIHIEGVNALPPLDYMEQLPKAYFMSKINMNLTIHSITTGIPLRIFDIMGVGGFILSSYQRDLDELFEIGKDLETYRCFEEMDDKVKYYLTHEKERLQVAYNGFNKVKEQYDNPVLIGKMLHISGVI